MKLKNNKAKEKILEGAKLRKECAHYKEQLLYRQDPMEARQQEMSVFEVLRKNKMTVNLELYSLCQLD